tara:strand:- start:109 stop:1161 length:1053 start_codon:yes stop_codon:yes gene_type:complete
VFITNLLLVLCGVDDATNREVLSSVVKSLDSIPVELVIVLTRIYEEVRASEYGEKEVEATQMGVGGFLFLRFICPAILSPETKKVNIMAEKPSPHQRRALTLVSKIIQCLSNGTSFSKKEAYMEVMAPFLERNYDKVYMFMRDVIERGRRELRKMGYRAPPPYSRCRSVKEEKPVQGKGPQSTENLQIIPGRDHGVQENLESVEVTPKDINVTKEAVSEVEVEEEEVRILPPSAASVGMGDMGIDVPLSPISPSTETLSDTMSLSSEQEQEEKGRGKGRKRAGMNEKSVLPPSAEERIAFERHLLEVCGVPSMTHTAACSPPRAVLYSLYRVIHAIQSDFDVIAELGEMI